MRQKIGRQLVDAIPGGHALESGELAVSRGFAKVSDGTRTHDRLDHNQELYQLSYAHRGLPNLALRRKVKTPAKPGDEGMDAPTIDRAYQQPQTEFQDVANSVAPSFTEPLARHQHPARFLHGGRTTIEEVTGR